MRFVGVLLFLLLLAAPAAAQDPAVPVPPPPAPTATPEPKPRPVAADLRLKVAAPHRAGGRRLAVPGETIRIRCALRPAVAGQPGLIQVRRGRKVVLRKPFRTRRDGRFSLRIRVRKAGPTRVRAIHRGSSKVRAVKSSTRRVAVVKPSVRFGESSALVRVFTRGLAKLKYAVGPRDTYDSRTGRAVMAYRKVNGLPRSEQPSKRIVRDVLAGRGGYKVRWPKLGRHVEVDLSKQILALVRGRRLVRVYHTSSGAPATPTILGTYSFYRKDFGTNSLGMVHAGYFIRGYAIHGYHSVPPFGASHGCLRVPIPDALNIYNWIGLGDKIRVVR